MSVHDLPAVNASLNALSGVLLLIAYVHIRARRIQQHRRFMLAAFTTSSLFLALTMKFARTRAIRDARRLFFGSIIYLPILWTLMIVFRA